MLKVAVIFESSPFDRKGLFNAVHSRVSSLAALGKCEMDVFCIHPWDTSFTRRMRHTPYIGHKCDSVNVDGIDYRMLWYDFSLVDFALVEKFRIRPFFFSRLVKEWLPLFRGYDRIIAHSFTGGLVAREISAAYGIPYFVSWHGSDIHTHPMRNSLKFKTAAEVMEGAVCNFFVSRALLETSDRITGAARKEVLYNGISDAFFRFPDSDRSAARERYVLGEDTKVVAFVGSIVAVKNVSVLQPLFHEIRSRYEGPLKFWMVGDGKLRGSVEPGMAADPTLDVRFWGDVPASDMPSMMNCMDVLVLPSLNEGLPLVCAEAVRCGVAVVGSDVGGIPEIIGRESVVPLGPDFVSKFADKVVGCLVSGKAPVSGSEALPDTSATAGKELDCLLRI